MIFYDKQRETSKRDSRINNRVLLVLLIVSETHFRYLCLIRNVNVVEKDLKEELNDGSSKENIHQEIIKH